MELIEPTLTLRKIILLKTVKGFCCLMQEIKNGIDRTHHYLDVKANNTGELFLAITESKRVLRNEESREIQFEKHKIFLYPKDFEKFIHGMNDVMEYIKSATDIK